MAFIYLKEKKNKNKLMFLRHLHCSFSNLIIDIIRKELCIKSEIISRTLTRLKIPEILNFLFQDILEFDNNI